MLVFKQLEIKINNLVQALADGQVIAMPTETAYGLIADSTNSKAIKKIYKIKGRNFKKPLPLICSSTYQVRNFFYLPSKVFKLTSKYWPGPLAIKLKIKSKKLKINSVDNTAVVRVSSNELLKNLARCLGKPITATSANISGKNNIYSAKEILLQFKNKKYQPDILVDGGNIKSILPSTIVDFTDGKFIILRQGRISI